jgi:hypothetical protein
MPMFEVPVVRRNLFLFFVPASQVLFCYAIVEGGLANLWTPTDMTWSLLAAVVTILGVGYLLHARDATLGWVFLLCVLFGGLAGVIWHDVMHGRWAWGWPEYYIIAVWPLVAIAAILTCWIDFRIRSKAFAA